MTEVDIIALMQEQLAKQEKEQGDQKLGRR